MFKFLPRGLSSQKLCSNCGKGCRVKQREALLKELSGVKPVQDTPGEDNYELALHLATSVRFTVLKRKIKQYLRANVSCNNC